MGTSIFAGFSKHTGRMLPAWESHPNIVPEVNMTAPAGLKVATNTSEPCQQGALPSFVSCFFMHRFPSRRAVAHLILFSFLEWIKWLTAVTSVGLLFGDYFQ